VLTDLINESLNKYMGSFRTNRGRAIFDEEKLYISSSWTGLLKRYYEGGFFGKLTLSSLTLLPIIYLFNFLMIRSTSFLEGVAIGTVIGAVLIALYYTVNYFRGFSYKSVISKDSIKGFKVIEGSTGLTQPRFIIKFEKSNEIKNRYIIMPSMLLSYGESEFEKAKKLIKEEGFEIIEE
jgi:hypothetical protein